MRTGTWMLAHTPWGGFFKASLPILVRLSVSSGIPVLGPRWGCFGCPRKDVAMVIAPQPHWTTLLFYVVMALTALAKHKE